MAEKANPYPSSDELLFSMLSHFSIFLGGVILPIIFWAVKKDQSQYVRFHSLQAIFFHIAYFVLIMVLVVIVMIVAIFTGMGASLTAIDSNGAAAGFSAIMMIFAILFYAALFAIIFGAIGYGIYMGIKSYQGELVMYPIIGKKVYEKVYGGT